MLLNPSNQATAFSPSLKAQISPINASQSQPSRLQVTRVSFVSRLLLSFTPSATMEMKKIACTILFTAASMSAVLADPGHHNHEHHSPAPAPGPSRGGASANLPLVGSLVGASLTSFIAYFLQY